MTYLRSYTLKKGSTLTPLVPYNTPKTSVRRRAHLRRTDGTTFPERFDSRVTQFIKIANVGVTNYKKMNLGFLGPTAKPRWVFF